MIFISHDLGVIAGISHRVAVMYAGWIVEEAISAEIFRNPLHPYTIALLEAIPTIGGEKKRLNSLPGQPPSAGEEIAGCKLHPRCPRKIAGLCDSKTPEYKEVSPGHQVRCFLYESL
jgi:peptide/nickel transport system ATP-binding protein